MQTHCRQRNPEAGLVCFAETPRSSGDLFLLYTHQKKRADGSCLGTRKSRNVHYTNENLIDVVDVQRW